MLQGLLQFSRVKAFVFAPDIGKFVAVGNQVRFENAALARFPCEPDTTRIDTLITIESINGNMGTSLKAEELAPLVASVLNKLRIGARRELTKDSA